MVSVGDTLPFPKEADFLASHSSHEDLPILITHRAIFAPGRCVIVAIARNCASTSNVFCKNIDNSGRGEGEPFQLRKSGNRSFWTNEEVTNEGLKFGCLLEYRVVWYHESLLRRCCDLSGELEKQFIFQRSAGTEPQNVDKILLDLQDDESVYGGLKEAHEYYNKKELCEELLALQNLFNVCRELFERTREHFHAEDMERFMKALMSILDTSFKPRVTHEYLKPKELCEELLALKNLFNVCHELFERTREHFHPEDFAEIQLGCKCLLSAYGELPKKTLECFNQKDVVELRLGLKCLVFVYGNRLKRALQCFNQKVVNKTPLDLLDDESVYGGLKEAHEYHYPMDLINERLFDQDGNVMLTQGQGYVNPEFYRLQVHSACTRIFFIRIRAGTISNERVTLETMNGEWLDMPLNCRENLVLSTRPVHLQLKRPWHVADDDVGGVAVVQYDEAGKATCEGLILRCKPLVISRDKEPVGILNGSGKVIPVTGRVLFDTGNEAATCITTELLLELNLQPGSRKKRKVGLPGGEIRKFEIIQIEPVIRGYQFPVSAMIDATPVDAALLVGMDIIEKLFDLGYTIGPSCSKEKKEKKKKEKKKKEKKEKEKKKEKKEN